MGLIFLLETDYVCPSRQARSKLFVAQLCVTLCHLVDCSPPPTPPQAPLSMEFFQARILLQGIFPPQASNQGLLHGRQILYCLSHQTMEACVYHVYIKPCHTCFENSWSITNTQKAGWVLGGAEAWRQRTGKHAVGRVGRSNLPGGGVWR